MNRLSLRTVIVTMMLVIALACTLLYNAVYGMLTDQTFSEMDLQSIGQNLDLAKTRLDHILLDAQTLLSDAETQIHAASYFDPGSFRRSIMQRLEYEVLRQLRHPLRCFRHAALHRRAQRRDLFALPRLFCRRLDSFRAGNAGNFRFPRTAGALLPRQL